MKIMLDPGHGGSDLGACNGVHHESVYALDIAKWLCAKLTAQGCIVGFTRTDDNYVSINSRYKIANTWGADTFVSIHLNSALGNAHGVETLVYSDTGKSAQLAALVQDKIIALTGAINRGIKVRTDLGVLRGTSMPAILVETGFISNTAECARLATTAYRQTIAEAIARGVCTWARITYKEDDNMITQEQFESMYNKVNPLYTSLAQVPPYWQEEAKALMACGAIRGDKENPIAIRQEELQSAIIARRCVLATIGK